MIERRLGPARVWWTDRTGGVSGARFASANLGEHVGDDAAAVAENRRRLAALLAADCGPVPPDPSRWVWLRQVHGARVATADTAPAVAPEADAAVTTQPGLPLVVLTADCAPLALANDDAVAVVHAGWPGLECGVIEAALDALRAAGHGEVRAVLGPCIRPARYAFGPDLLDRLVRALGPGVASTTVDGRPALDIPAAVRAALARRGVTELEDAGVCTAASDAYFSHRREGVTGRQAVVAVLEP